MLVVDDVLTTGGSVRDTVEAVRARGAEVVGVGVMVNRGASPDFGAPLFACLNVEVASWDPGRVRPLPRGRSPRHHLSPGWGWQGS